MQTLKELQLIMKVKFSNRILNVFNKILIFINLIT